MFQGISWVGKLGRPVACSHEWGHEPIFKKAYNMATFFNWGIRLWEAGGFQISWMVQQGTHELCAPLPPVSPKNNQAGRNESTKTLDSFWNHPESVPPRLLDPRNETQLQEDLKNQQGVECHSQGLNKASASHGIPGCKDNICISQCYSLCTLFERKEKTQNGQRSGGCIICADGIQYPKEKIHLKLPYIQSLSKKQSMLVIIDVQD